MELSEEFTLLIPAYNPSDGWEGPFYTRFVEFCAAIKKKVNVILINDGSSSDFSSGVNFLKDKIGSDFSFIGYDINRGKGAALKFGAKHAHSSKYMFTDIDFPYSTESMKNVYQTMQKHTGIVVGYRESDYYEDLSLLRTLLSKGLRLLNKIILNLPVNDTQCGLKAFDEEVKDILLDCATDRFLIDLELLMAVNKKSLSIIPVSVQLREDIDFTKFNASVLLKEVFSILKLIWKYRL